MGIRGTWHKSSLLFANETTYGTAPGTATDKLEFDEFTWGTPENAIEDVNMNSDGASSRAIEQGLLNASGSLRMRLGFEGCEGLWRWLLPTYSVGLVGGETLVRDHLVKEGTSLKSSTFDVSYGDIPTGKATRFLGVLCSGFDLDLNAGGVGILNATWACNGAPTNNTTPMSGTPAVANKLAISHHGHLLRNSGNLKDGSGLAETAIYVASLRLSVRYPLIVDRGYGGSQWADSPVRGGPMTARIECETHWDAANYVLMDKILTNSPAAGGLKFLWQHPTTIGNASKRELEIIASSPKAGPAYQNPIPGAGIIAQRFGWALQFNDTDASCIKVRVRSLAGVLA